MNFINKNSFDIYNNNSGKRLFKKLLQKLSLKQQSNHDIYFVKKK